MGKQDSKARLTIIEQIYYQMSGSSPILAESRYSRQLELEDQPYSRRIRVGASFAPIDYGWLTKGDVSMVVVKNVEEVDDKTKVLEIAVNETPFACLHPGESIQFRPASQVIINLRSQSGDARALVNLFPR